MTFISSDAIIAFRKEGAFKANESGTGSTGVAATSVNRPFGILNQGIRTPDIQREVSRFPSLGSGRNAARVKNGRDTLVGSIPWVPTNGEFLYHAFGAVTGEAQIGTTGTYDHSVSVGSSVPSFTLGVGLNRGATDFQRRWIGCYVSSLSVSGSVGQPLQASAEIVAADVLDDITATAGTNGAPTTDSLVSTITINGGTQPSLNANDHPFMFWDTASAVTILGQSVARVTGFNFTLNNSLETHHFMAGVSSRRPGIFTPGFTDARVTFDLVPEGHTAGTDSLYSLLDSTDSSLDCQIDFTYGTAATAARRRLLWAFTNCLMSSAPHPLEPSGNAVRVTADITPESVTLTTIDAVSTY